MSNNPGVHCDYIKAEICTLPVQLVYFGELHNSILSFSFSIFLKVGLKAIRYKPTIRLEHQNCQANLRSCCHTFNVIRCHIIGMYFTLKYQNRNQSSVHIHTGIVLVSVLGNISLLCHGRWPAS